MYDPHKTLCTHIKYCKVSFKDDRSVSYTLIISHKFCKMLSIINKLTLQNDLQNFMTNSVFMDKK